jgi:hypothetical protein
MTQCCHHLHESTNELVASHSRVSVFGFVLVLFLCFAFFGFVSCAFAVCLVDDDDGLLDYVQVLHQFSFVALNSRWP